MITIVTAVILAAGQVLAGYFAAGARTAARDAHACLDAHIKATATHHAHLVDGEKSSS